jgi:sulfur-carrier protein
MATVHLDPMLRDFVPHRTVATDSSTVEGLLQELEGQFPRLRYRIRDETGSLRRFVRIFVNGNLIESLQGMATPLGARDEVDILHSIQGG